MICTLSMPHCFVYQRIFLRICMTTKSCVHFWALTWSSRIVLCALILPIWNGSLFCCRSGDFVCFNPKQVLGVVAATGTSCRNSVNGERILQDLVVPYKVCWLCLGPVKK